MTWKAFVWALCPVCVCSFTKVWVTHSQTAWHTQEHTPIHTQKGTFSNTRSSPSPVNAWNKWLLQWRQCEHTTMPHLISCLHENLFVLDRVYNNQPASCGNSEGPGWLHLTWLNRHANPAHDKGRMKINGTERMTTIGLHHRISKIQILSRSERLLQRLIPPPFLAIWFLCCHV